MKKIFLLQIKIIQGAIFIFKYIYYKILYGSKFYLELKNSYIGGKIQIRGNGRFSGGKNFRSRENSKINITDGELIIGENFFMNEGCKINCKEKITIGDDVMLGENILIYDHDHLITPNGASRKEFNNQPIEIGSKAWIGSGTIITKGVKIGSNSVIAAGSIITKDTPDNAIIIQHREIKITYL